MKYLKLSLFMVLGLVSFCMSSQNNLKESINKGKRIYRVNCVTCHMVNGEGMIGAFPPLAKSDYLMEDTERSIKTVLNGASGEMKVNGVTYYGAMVGYSVLTDQQVADVMNYVRNSWGNKGEIVKAETVAKIRE